MGGAWAVSMKLYTGPWSHTEPQLPHLLSEFMPLTFTIPSVKWAWPPCFPFKGCPDVMCVKPFAQSLAHDHYLTSVSSHCFRGSAIQFFTYLHLPLMLMCFADKSAAASPRAPRPERQAGVLERMAVLWPERPEVTSPDKAIYHELSDFPSIIYKMVGKSLELGWLVLNRTITEKHSSMSCQ